MASNTLSQLVVVAVIASIVAVSCTNRRDVQPIATIQQIMETTVEPVSETVFNAAVWVNGVQVGGPKTDDDWEAVQASAMMLAETSNLLLMPGRAKDQTGWVNWTEDMKNAAMEAARAAEAKNTDAIFNAGTHIYQACTGCHVQYAPQLTVPPQRKGE